MSPARHPLYLVRHGQTRGNAERVVQTPDAPLSPDGRAQAQRLAERLRDAGVALVLCSDLRRSAQTAERVAASTGAALETDPDLQERNFGALRGTSYAELDARGVALLAADLAPPGGESWEVFHARVDAAWSRIRERLARVDGSVAVVTHGLVCASLVERHLALPAPGAAPLRFDNTGVTVVEPAPPWRVALLNCTAHLH